MFDKRQQKVFAGCCMAAFAFFALICLVMHFSFAGLLIFIGAAAMVVGIFAEALEILLPCGFAVTAVAYLIEFVWYVIQSFSRGFTGFFLLFPILACLLMIFIFAGLLKLTLFPKHARGWGIALTAAAFAAMLLVVATAFAGYFKGTGEVNYFVFLQRLVLIPLGFFFGGWMEGEEPLLMIDLQKTPKEETEAEGPGQVIGYTPEEVMRRRRRAAQDEDKPETEEESETDETPETEE